MSQIDKPLEVVFRHQPNGEIIGNLVSDPRPTVSGERSKIVLIYGFKKESANKWQGDLPKDGETWVCEELRDTKPTDSRSGAILVRLLDNLSRRSAQAKEQHRARLAPIYGTLNELARLMEEPPAQDALDNLAQALCALAEDAAIRLGFTEAIKLFLRAADSTLPELRFLSKEKSPELATRPAWRMIEELGLSGRLHKCCFEAVLAWLTKLRDLGEMPVRKFVLSYDHFFQCPGCTAKVRLKPEEWAIYSTGDEVVMQCPVCNTEGLATK